jgi:hypothetical protein
MKIKKYRLNSSQINKLEKSKIIIDNGVCSLETNSDILGIEINFLGKAEITPQLPNGWIMQGNSSKMLIISLQGFTISNSILFTYVGTIKILNAIVCNKNGERISVFTKQTSPNWNDQTFDFSIDTTNWGDYKSRKAVGKVKKTKYILPDYNLPKVEKTKIKNTRKTTETTPTYTTGTSSGSSSGSGGY